jgi:hypothetical protein
MHLQERVLESLHSWILVLTLVKCIIALFLIQRPPSTDEVFEGKRVARRIETDIIAMIMDRTF